MMTQSTKTTDALARAAREAAEFGRENFKAVAQSAQLWFQGAQDLGRQALAFTEQFNAQAIIDAKALTGAKSLKEAAELQTRFVRSAFERAASEGPRLQQAAFQATERALAPLADRAKAAVAQAARPLGA
jgi:phasin family protein